MNNSAKAIGLVTVVLISALSISVLWDSVNGEEVDLAYMINNGDKTTIDLDKNNTYTLTGDSSINKETVKINGNGATLKISGDVQFNAGMAGTSKPKLSMSDLTIASDEASFSFSLYNWKDLNISGCGFTNVKLFVGNTTGNYIQNTSVTDNVFTSGVTDKGYAITVNSDDILVSKNTISGYGRGINVNILSDGTDRILINNNTISELKHPEKPLAFQVSNDVQDREVLISGNTVTGGFGLSIYYNFTTTHEGGISLVANNFNDCGKDILYSTDDKASNKEDNAKFETEMTFIGDNFVKNGVATSPVFSYEDSVISDIPTEKVDTINNATHETAIAWYGSDEMTISTEKELREFAELVNWGIDFHGKTVKLGGDITLTPGWVPIGTEVTPFSGTFDGDKHSIDGLKITKTDATVPDLYLGLFGAVSGTPTKVYVSTDKWTQIDQKDYTAVIKNLTIMNPEIKSNGSKVGALVGEANDAYIYNVHVYSGVVNGTNSIGGIVGRGYGTIIDSCSTENDIKVNNGLNGSSSAYNYGGIVGSIRKSQTGDGLSAVLNSTNNAILEVYLHTGGVGGIVGHISGGQPAVISGCKNYGDITITGNPKIYSAYSAVAGGIGGQCQGDETNLIIGCHNYGTVTGSMYEPTGAIAGIVNYYNGTVKDSTNSGDIEGNAYYSAGIVGHGGTVIIDNCSNIGNITVGLETGHISSICAGASNTTYANMQFPDVESLENALVKAAKTASELTDTGAVLTLQNVVVDKNDGTLTLPKFLNTLTSNTKICQTVNIVDRNVHIEKPYQTNITINIGIPGAIVNVDDVIGTKSVEGSIRLSSDNMTLNFGEGSKVGTIYVGADGTVIKNMGTIGWITDSNGTIEDSGKKSMTIYNGDEKSATAKLGHITANFISATVYNYGTMEYEGYLLSVGYGCKTSTVQNNEFTFYNYGNFIGNAKFYNEKNEEITTLNYMMYIPAAKSFTFYSYPDSKVINNANPTTETIDTWFIYYGNDGVSNNDPADPQGTFTWYYSENTVFRPNGSDLEYVAPSEAMWVGKGNNDAEGKFTLLEDSKIVKVTFDNGFGVEQYVDISKDSTPDVPTLSLAGLTFKGWYDESGNAWEVGPVSGNITLTAKWTVAEPIVVTSGPTSVSQGVPAKFTASVSNASQYVDYTFSWKTGEQSSTGASVTVTLGSNTVISVTVSATPKTGCANVSGKSEAISNIEYAFVPLNSVTFIFDGTDWKNAVVNIPISETLSAQDVPLSDHPGFEVLIEEGYNTWIGSDVTANMQVHVTVATDSLFTVDSMDVLTKQFKIPIKEIEGLKITYTLPEELELNESGIVTIPDDFSDEIIIKAELTGTGKQYELTITHDPGALSSEDPSMELIATSSDELRETIVDRVNNIQDVPRNGMTIVLDVSRTDGLTDGIPFWVDISGLPSGLRFIVIHFGSNGVDYPGFHVVGDRMLITPSGFSPFAIIAYEENTEPETPSNPGWDDDDDYPYIPPTVVDNNKSDDESVKVAACAAAAVLAALVATFLIMDIRRK